MARLPSSYCRGGEISIEVPMDTSLISAIPVDFIILINTGVSCVAVESKVTDAEMHHDTYGYDNYTISNLYSSYSYGAYNSVLSLRGYTYGMHVMKGEDDQPRFIS